MSSKGIETDSKKVAAICDWPKPQMVTEVHSFLGLTNYYRKFIHSYAQIAKPLNALVSGVTAKSKKRLIEWNEDCETAFQKLKELFTEMPILVYANNKKSFCFKMDASEKSVGSLLY